MLARAPAPTERYFEYFLGPSCFLFVNCISTLWIAPRVLYATVCSVTMGMQTYSAYQHKPHTLRDILLYICWSPTQTHCEWSKSRYCLQFLCIARAQMEHRIYARGARWLKHRFSTHHARCEHPLGFVLYIYIYISREMSSGDVPS